MHTVVKSHAEMNQENDGFTMVSIEEIKDWSEWCQAPPEPDDAEAELMRFFKSYTTETSYNVPILRELSEIIIPNAIEDSSENAQVVKNQIPEVPPVPSTRLRSGAP